MSTDVNNGDLLGDNWRNWRIVDDGKHPFDHHQLLAVGDCHEWGAGSNITEHATITVVDHELNHQKDRKSVV